MSALPLIEAVRRAGGTIVLNGDRLRLAAPAPLPPRLLEEVRQHKTDLVHHLQRTAQPPLREPAAAPPGAAAGSPGETVAAWAAGVARLAAIPPPRNYPEHAWQQLIVDAERFLDGWAAAAHRLGWPAWELFGCCRQAPWGRVQGMGLVLLLRGRGLAVLTATEAVIRPARGAHLTHRRKPCDPLRPNERCLAWELR